MNAPAQVAWTAEDYLKDARQYRASLPLEHFMEGPIQATQRRATLCSMEWLEDALGGFVCFNELLVQAFHLGELERAVPDNMLVLGDPGNTARESWAVELERCELFMALEYVSRNDPEKDYDKNFLLYESVFRFQYYLIFDPLEQSLLMYRLRDGKFMPLEPDGKGRFLVPRLELAIGLRNGWVRFWFRGDLIPITKELRRQMLQLQEEYDKLTTAFQALSKETASIRNTNTALVSEKATLVSEKATLVSEKATLEADKSKLHDQLQTAQAQSDALLTLLRSLVEPKARLAGRQDILDRLATTSDPAQLQTWLVELA